MRKPLLVSFCLAGSVASATPAIAHNCHRDIQYSVKEGNHSHAGAKCDVNPIIKRPDSLAKDRDSPAGQKVKSPSDKGSPR